MSLLLTMCQRQLCVYTCIYFRVSIDKPGDGAAEPRALSNHCVCVGDTDTLLSQRMLYSLFLYFLYCLFPTEVCARLSSL